MKAALTSRKSRVIRLLWLAESILLVAAVLAAAWARFLNDPEGLDLFISNAPMRAAVVATFITISMAAFGLYQVHVRLNRLDFVLRLLMSFAFGGIALLVLY